MRSFAAVLALVLVGLSSAAPARAAVRIAPTSVELDGTASSSSVALNNDSPQPIRLQVTAYRWQQNDVGEMLESPTRDLVAFPLLVTVPAFAKQLIRIAVTTPASERERTYRLVIAQLPSADAVATRDRSVSFLMRYSIPVRFAPRLTTISHRYGRASVAGGVASLELVNDGTVSFRMSEVVAVIANASRREIGRKPVDPGVVLAGDTRAIRVPLSERVCRDARTVTLSLAIDGATTAHAFPIDARDCPK